MTTNGVQGPPAEQDDIDYQRLVGDLSAQVGALTTEVLARGQVIDKLRGEVARLSSVNESEHVK